MLTKLVPETTLYKFQIKIYLGSFVSFMWNLLQKYFIQLEHHIELLVPQ